MIPLIFNEQILNVDPLKLSENEVVVTATTEFVRESS